MTLVPVLEEGAVAATLSGVAGVRGWSVNAEAAAGNHVIPVVRTLTASDGPKYDGDTEPFVIQDVRGGTRDRTDHGQGIGIRQGAMYTLSATERHAVAYPLRARHDSSEDGTGRRTPLVPAAFAERGRKQGRTLEWQENIAYCLTNPGSGGRTHSRQIMDQHMAIRRLTPREAEILQGFPPGWTCLCDARGDTMTCRCPDSPRYRALGNAVAVPVAEWIAQRIIREVAGQ